MAGRRGERPRWGLVLGGGAARGIAHVGVLRVLEEEGLCPDLVVGTSAGALAGVCLAARISPARMAGWAERLSWGRLVRPVVNRLGLTSNEGLGRFLTRVLPVRRFDELTVPFACMATDVESAEPVLLCEGDLVSALRASCAIPGLVVPVERDGRLLMDGGVTQNVPTGVARLFGMDVVVAVDVNGSYQHGRAPGNMLSIVLRSFFAISRAAEAPAREQADILIAPDVLGVAVDDLGRHRELIAAGEAAAREGVAALRALLEAADPRSDRSPVPLRLAS